jgi:hypothetical protein
MKILNFYLGKNIDLIFNKESENRLLINILYKKEPVIIILIKFKDISYFIDYTYDYMINLILMFLKSHSDNKIKSHDFYENIFEIEVYYNSNSEKIGLIISQNKELLKDAIIKNFKKNQ